MPGTVVDVVEHALDHRAGVASAECALVGVAEVLLLERGDGRRSVLSVAIEIRVGRETSPEDLERETDGVGVGCPFDRAAEGLGGRGDSAGDVLDAVEEVVRVLVLVPVVEGEGLEADKADDVGMADSFADDTAVVEQFGLNLDDTVMFPDDRDVGDMHGGHSLLVRKRGGPPDDAARVVAQEFDDDEGVGVGAPFPPPGRAAAIFARGATHTQVPEVALERPISLDFDEESKVDHQVQVAGARVRPYAPRRFRHKVARSEAADEVDAVLPGTQSSQQADQNALAGLRRMVVVVAIAGGHRGQ